MALFVLLTSARPALATYSIVASDTATRQAGGAGTSCLRGSDVYVIYGAAPGRGVVHAQALANQAGRDRAVELLEQGMAPADILAAITASSFDSNATRRQYGVVDVTGRSAGFTGTGTGSFADDVQGQIGTFSYSVQGNILTGAAVLTQAAAAFESSAACDLADRLIRALEAGAENGEGDSRCTDSLGIPADSAFLQVESPTGAAGSFLSLRVRTSGQENPMIALRADYDAWRRANPCAPSPGGAGGAGNAGAGNGGADSGGAGNAGAGNGGTAGRAGGAGSGGAGIGGAAAGSSGTTAGSSGAAGGAGAPASGDAASGCDCRLGRPVEGFGACCLAALAGLACTRRRTRR